MEAFGGKTMFDSLTLSNLPLKQCGILRRATSTRPAIRVVEEDGVRAIVKDFSTNRFLYRNTIGRFLVWREKKAYTRLRHIPGVPGLYRVIGGLALVMEEIPGRNLENLEKERKLPEGFFDELRELVDRVHAAGVVHCDLKRAPNTLITPDGRPHIIDWGACILASEFAFYPLKGIYRRFMLDDYMAVIKLKLRHVPDAVTPAEKRRYAYRSPAEILIRSIRDRLRDLLQKVA